MRMINISLGDGQTAVLIHGRGSPDQLVGYDAASREQSFYAKFYQGSEGALIETRRRQGRTLLARILRFKSKGLLLDVGCGKGAFVDLVNAQASALRAMGLEPGLPHDSATLKKGDLEGLPEARVYDVITFLDVFEHIENSANALEKAHRVLADDGIMVLKVPNKDSLLYRLTVALAHLGFSSSRKLLRRMYQVDYHPPHFYYFNRRSLSALVTSAGWQVIDVVYLPELYVTSLWRRIWDVPLIAKPFYWLAGLALIGATPGRLKDSVAVLVKKQPQK